MKTSEFMQRMGAAGVGVDALALKAPELCARLAAQWEWGHMFRKTVEMALDGTAGGAGMDSAGAMALKRMFHLREAAQKEASPKASSEALRGLGEEGLGAIERGQAALTSSLAQLLRAAHARLALDELAALGEMRALGVDFNQKDRDGLTPAAVAAQHGAEKCLFGLFKGGANPHVCDSMGNAPLHWAAATGQPKALGILLYHGANPNAVNHAGVTPMMLAVAKSRSAMAQRLLDYGADLRMRDRKGNTALHRAVLAGNAQMARFLWGSGAGEEERNNEGATPKAMASRSSEMSMVFDMGAWEAEALQTR
jgi:hypothetical protein